MYIMNIFKSWFPLAIVITGLCGLVYSVVQQNYRMSLNDPQIQMAEDAAVALAEGADPTSLQGNVDIGKSLSPYLTIYDDSAKPVASSGKLNGELPAPPQGIFDVARTKGENRISWQPQSDVRSAIVVVHYAGDKPGFVLAGRNMREVEERESKLLQMVGLSWAVLLLLTLIIQIILSVFPFAKSPKGIKKPAS